MPAGASRTTSLPGLVAQPGSHRAGLVGDARVVVAGRQRDLLDDAPGCFFSRISPRCAPPSGSSSVRVSCGVTSNQPRAGGPQPGGVDRPVKLRLSQPSKSSSHFSGLNQPGI